MHPEVVGAKLLIVDGRNLKCVLPCVGSKECDCVNDWNVTPLPDTTEVCD